MEILKECRLGKGNSLVFRDLTAKMKNKKRGEWVWVKKEKNGTLTEILIKPHKEQVSSDDDDHVTKRSLGDALEMNSMLRHQIHPQSNRQVQRY